MNKQTQKGGSSSTNLQAEQMVVQVGIDEKRAREIYQEMNLQLKKDYTEEALRIAEIRVAEFENRLMPKMENVEGALEAFADPSFQILLVEAQKTAASTERVADYDLLSELLIHRFQRGENRVTRAGVSRAVEIVDEIADDALVGLTAFHAVNAFLPSSGDIFQGLDALDQLFKKLLYGPLPSGRDWLDHLDILDAVRLSSFGSLKKIDQYYPELLHGYVDAGIKKDSDDFDKAQGILKANSLPTSILVEHALNSNYVRIPVPARQEISSLNLVKQAAHQGRLVQFSVPLSEKQKDAVSSIYDLYDKSSHIKGENTRILVDSLEQRKSLKILRAWWNNLDVAVQITPVGRVLAHSNAQRCDKGLPPFN